jgi:type II secretory pathway pseudopilin PulG
MSGRRSGRAQRARRERRAGEERGESLLELLIAVAILGIAVVAIVAGMATAITASDANRKQARAETLLRNFAEALTDPAVGYVDCATPASYTTSPPGFTVPTGFSVSIVAVRYWNGTTPAAFTSTCPSPDTGIQHLTVRVTASDSRADKTLGFVKRREGVTTTTTVLGP